MWSDGLAHGPNGQAVDIDAGRLVEGKALCSPLFDSDTTGDRGCANFPRYFFLDPGSRDFFVDWDEGAAG